MSLSNTFESDLLKLIFQNTGISLVGDATGLLPSGAAGSLYISLHTADPGEGGDQTTSECNYTNYARVAVVRSSSGWTISGSAPTQVVNAAQINFPACTGGSNIATHFGIGTSSSGAGKLICSGNLGKLEWEGTGKASNDTITIPGHDFSVGDVIEVEALGSQAIPGGISLGILYFVKTVSGNDITISATSGGATLDITSDGAGVFSKDVSLAISNGITPQFAAGALAGYID